MNILLISGHKKNWDAGASTVFLHLECELQRLGHNVLACHAEDYQNDSLPVVVQKIVMANLVERRMLSKSAVVDVVEVAGNLAWRLFERLRALPDAQRPLLVNRVHALELKDEQARIDEEIALQQKLPVKYKLFNRHWTNWQEFRSITLADVVICHTTREADAIIAAGLKTEDRVVVMPLGVDADYFVTPGYPEGGNRLLWWGSWIDRKGISAIPRAFDLACRVCPDLTLTLGGTGAAPQAILPLFSEEARSRVTVLPFLSREQHIQTLQQHDIFVFPSLSEGFGLALLEAMATGLPCITTFTGLAHDWLEHGENCLLVPMSAPTTLARAIERLSGDIGLRRTLGSRAQATARGLTWDRFGNESNNVYKTFVPKLRA